MEQLMNGLYNVVNSVTPVIHLAVAAALIVVGFLFIIPSEKSKQAAKSALPFVVLGCGIVLLATTLATEISSKFVF